MTLVQSQLQIQVSKCSDYERILGHKNSEIKRLMTELDVVNQSLVSLREMREQLEASLAASSASRIGESRLVFFIPDSVSPKHNSGFDNPFDGQLLNSFDAHNNHDLYESFYLMIFGIVAKISDFGQCWTRPSHVPLARRPCFSILNGFESWMALPLSAI